MERITLTQHIKVYFVTATSFPEGVLQAHQTLHSLVPYSSTRKYFGLSRPENGIIVYRAAAEQLQTEYLGEHNLQEMIIPKGEYISITIKNFTQNITSIRNAFEELIGMPGIDPNGYCVEWYLSDTDVRCMVRLHPNA